MIENMHTPVKATLEVAAFLGVIGTLVGYLPYIAAGFSIAWYIYSFYKEFK